MVRIVESGVDIRTTPTVGETPGGMVDPGLAKAVQMLGRGAEGLIDKLKDKVDADDYTKALAYRKEMDVRAQRIQDAYKQQGAEQAGDTNYVDEEGNKQFINAFKEQEILEGDRDKWMDYMRDRFKDTKYQNSVEQADSLIPERLGNTLVAERMAKRTREAKLRMANEIKSFATSLNDPEMSPQRIQQNYRVFERQIAAYKEVLGDDTFDTEKDNINRVKWGAIIRSVEENGDLFAARKVLSADGKSVSAADRRNYNALMNEAHREFNRTFLDRKVVPVLNNAKRIASLDPKSSMIMLNNFWAKTKDNRNLDPKVRNAVVKPLVDGVSEISAKTYLHDIPLENASVAGFKSDFRHNLTVTLKNMGMDPKNPHVAKSIAFQEEVAKQGFDNGTIYSQFKSVKDKVASGDWEGALGDVKNRLERDNKYTEDEMDQLANPELVAKLGEQLEKAEGDPVATKNVYNQIQSQAGDNQGHLMRALAERTGDYSLVAMSELAPEDILIAVDNLSNVSYERLAKDVSWLKDDPNTDSKSRLDLNIHESMRDIYDDQLTNIEDRNLFHFGRKFIYNRLLEGDTLEDAEEVMGKYIKQKFPESKTWSGRSITVPKIEHLTPEVQEIIKNGFTSSFGLVEMYTKNNQNDNDLFNNSFLQNMVRLTGGNDSEVASELNEIYSIRDPENKKGLLRDFMARHTYVQRKDGKTRIYTNMFGIPREMPFWDTKGNPVRLEMTDSDTVRLGMLNDLERGYLRQLFEGGDTRDIREKGIDNIKGI